jgi:chromosome segregation ATPase
LEAARKELDSARFELNNTRSQHSAALLKEADTRKQEAAAYTRKIQDLADDLQTLRVANNQLQESLKSQSGPSSQVDLLLRQQAADKATIEEAKSRARASEERLGQETARLSAQTGELERVLRGSRPVQKQSCHGGSRERPSQR